MSPSYRLTQRMLEAITLPYQHWERPADTLLTTVTGMTTLRILRTLNFLCRHDDVRHLEVGTHCGASIIGAAAGNKHGLFVTIDNYCQFGNHMETAAAHIREHAPHVITINEDFFKAAPALAGSNFNQFYYDGHHDVEPTAEALPAALPALADQFIYIVDDFNWDFVRIGVKYALEKSGCQIYHDVFLTNVVSPSGSTGWWNGWYMAVLSKTPIDNPRSIDVVARFDEFQAKAKQLIERPS